MTKKDFFVITESDNLYLDLAPCSGYIVFDTIGIYKAPFFCYYKYRKEISKMKEPKVIKVMEHYEAYKPDKPISKKTFLCSGDYEWEALEDARAILAQRESEKKRE